MKIITLNSIHKIIVILCLFALGNSYGQVKNATHKTLFGKSVSPENINPKTGQIRCATTEYEKFLQQKNPKRMTSEQFESWLAPLVQKQKAIKANSKMAVTIITIPVVVHVIHSGQAIGIAPNIGDAQVQSQITVLNQDYRKMTGTPGDNTNPVGADTQIQFVLAQVDPNGNPTNGIDRVNFSQSTWSEEEIDAIIKPATIWDPTQYLNIWSVDFSNSTLLGYAQSPDGSGLSGIGTSGGAANTDGVVSRYEVFGSKDFDTNNNFLLDTKYNKGRTMTHEIGHFLGLIHIWGDTTCGNDYCDDTPTHHNSNFDCPTIIPQSCDLPSVPEMIQNYMDYTDDYCMNIFTNNQATRMATVMANSPRRKTLATSNKGTAIPLFANDAEIKIEAGKYNINYGCNTPPSPTDKQITLYNRGTSTLTSVTLNYTINGGTTQTYDWTGSLAQNKSEVVTLSNTNLYGILNVTITKANGITDQRSSNNTATATFAAPASPTNYTFNSLLFTLQQDNWGSETTWSLKDGSGSTLYSGGPYSDNPNPALLTFNFNLTNNQCYTFSINDSQGDGICCGETSPENGYYSLKSSDGLTTLLAGTSFGYSDSKSFTINKTLGNDKFETVTDIYLYPNPTKGILNIQVPTSFGLPEKYSISNTLGQLVSQKNISKQADLTINTSTLSNGVYFITLSKENQKRTLRFIKE